MFRIQAITEQDLQFIKKEMLDSAGIDLKNFKSPFLTRRVTARMLAKGVRAGSEYAQLLSQDPLEPLTLYNSLSINVTECFRDPTVWDIFTTKILSNMISTARTDVPIRIWSAGCATGQEPYSLAIMFKEAIGSSNVNFKIYATDMNKVSINIAKTGKFDPKSLKNIPKTLLPKYVTKLDDELYQVHKDLIKNIEFSVGDVISLNMDSLDLIVCRNLLIYYGRPAQELLFKKFYHSLNDKGRVILGMDESMVGTEGIKFFKADYPRQRIFSKIPGAL